MLLVYISISFLVGIVAASVAALPPIVWAIWLALPLASLYFFRDSFLRQVNFCALALLLGALRYATAIPQIEPNSLAALNEHGSITISGIVTAPPDVRDHWTQLRVSVRSKKTAGTTRELDGDALVIVPRESQVEYGDVIEFAGAPTTPFESPDFSYKDYLARQGIHSLVRVDGNVIVLERDKGDFFMTQLYALRERTHQTILLIFPEPAASLLAGILLGIDSGIPTDLRDAFNVTNTAHIVAISGFNVSVIAGILSAFARRVFGQKRTMPLVIAGLIVYTFLAGANASVVRAAIMGSLAVVALHYNRQDSTLNALLAAALLMGAFNPNTIWDLSFQLSFLATLGIVLYADRLMKAIDNLIAHIARPEWAKRFFDVLGDSLTVTLAAQITTTPLVIFISHRISIVGLFTNLLVLPAQPSLMVWGGAATIAGMIYLPLAHTIAWIAWAFLEWTIVIVQTTANLPFAAVEIGKLDTLLLASYYLILFGLVHPNLGALGERLAFRPALVAGAAIVVGGLVWNIYASVPDGKMRATFLDGASPATFVQTPKGAKVLIDGGSDPSALLAFLGQRMPFWDRQIDLIIRTSADEAHLSGLIDVLERYDVKQIAQSDVTGKPSAARLRWDELIAARRVPCTRAEAGLKIAVDDGVTVDFLSPPSNATGAQTAILKVRAGQVVFLFADAAGTLDQIGLSKADTELASTVLIAPRKIAPEFLGAVKPQYSVLFTGTAAGSVPSPDLLSNLSDTTILQTHDRGTIEMIVDGQAINIRTAR